MSGLMESRHVNIQSREVDRFHMVPRIASRLVGEGGALQANVLSRLGVIPHILIKLGRVGRARISPSTT